MRPSLSAATALAAFLVVFGAGVPAARAASGPSPSEAATALADWAYFSGDNGGHPFVVIDKVAAAVFVYDSDGILMDSAPALMGLARGDGSVPGIGERPLSQIRPEERTTPAGRFVGAFGPERDMKEVFWIDYDDAISLHPVIAGEPGEHRLQRLRSETPDDNRITFGCVNVPRAFYDKVMRKTFAGAKAVVYVLPEEKPLLEVFPGLPLEVARIAGETANGAAR